MKIGQLRFRAPTIAQFNSVSRYSHDSIFPIFLVWVTRQNVTDVTLVVEDANSKLVDVVAFADVGIQEGVDEGW